MYKPSLKRLFRAVISGFKKVVIVGLVLEYQSPPKIIFFLENL